MFSQLVEPMAPLVDKRTIFQALFDDDMNLVGWTNIETGEVKSPYPEIKSLSGYSDSSLLTLHSSLKLFAFSGIHAFSPRLFADMEQWPEKFPIIDFYLNRCAERKIKGYLKSDLKLLDVGKLDTLASAESMAPHLSFGHPLPKGRGKS